MYQGAHTCSQGSGQFNEGQFERVSHKPGFNTPDKPELERPVFLPRPTFGLDPFESASSDSGVVLKYPEKPELKPEVVKLEMMKLEPELVKPVLSNYPASKLFGEDRENQFPVYKIPLKSEPVWEDKPLHKLEPFWEEKPFQIGPKFVQGEELLSTPYKDVMAWYAMGKQTQIGRPNHAFRQKVFIFFNKQISQVFIFFNKQEFPSVFLVVLTYPFVAI